MFAISVERNRRVHQHQILLPRVCLATRYSGRQGGCGGKGVIILCLSHAQQMSPPIQISILGGEEMGFAPMLAGD